MSTTSKRNQALDDLRREARVKALQSALIAGEESGPAETFDSDAFLREMHEKYIQEPEG